MPSEANALGYLALALFIILPGLGVGEILNIWQKGEGLLERLGLAFGLGIAIDTIVLFVRSSGLSVLSLSLRGIDMTTVELTIGLGAVGFVVSLIGRRRILFPVKPSRIDLLLISLVLVQGTVLLLYFQKYPVFPEYQSADFANHVTLTKALISGTGTSFPEGLLYYGVHFQLAAALLVIGGEPLVTLQRTMAVLAALSPLLVFVAGDRLFSDRSAAIITAMIYTVSGFIWFPSVFGSGLFPNFFGILASLFLLATAVALAKEVRSRGNWMVFLSALVMAYLSHFSTVTLFPALLALPIVQFLKFRQAFYKYALPTVVAIVPVAIGVALFPGLTSYALYLASSGGGTIFGSTAISTVLASIPVLSYMALEVTDDVAFVLLVFFAGVYAYRLRHADNPFLFVPLVWLLALLVASPYSVSAWRFSFEALVPLTLMAGYGLNSVVPKPRVSRRGKTIKYTTTLVVLFILLTPILATSWGEISVADSLTNTQASASSQQEVYTALGWLENNTASNSTYLSVSDWRFTYSSLFFGRTTDYSYIPTPTDAVRIARQGGISYIIVTNVVTVTLPPNPSLFPWNTYQPSSNLTLVYSNSDVRVFLVT